MSSFARPERQITPKTDKAALLGVSTSAIAKTVNIATVGDIDRNLSKFSLGARQIPVRILLNDIARSDMASLSMLQVPTFEEPVPLSSVADISFGSGPLQIERTDHTRSETIEAELGGLRVGEARKFGCSNAFDEAVANGSALQACGRLRTHARAVRWVQARGRIGHRFAFCRSRPALQRFRPTCDYSDGDPPCRSGELSDRC